MAVRKTPVGIDDFEKLRTGGFYFVDKTGLIRELLENWGEVNLFTRPRRFGKSLNMSMLKSFFEIGTDADDTEIWNCVLQKAMQSGLGKRNLSLQTIRPGVFMTSGFFACKIGVLCYCD